MANEPTHLDLFSGIGGFALAAQWAGFRTIGFCEIDRYCQKVLAKNFGGRIVANPGNGLELREGQTELDMERDPLSRRERGQATDRSRTNCPIFGDIFELDGRQFRGVDLITGGFPCQPFSVAGKRRGAADDRAIWPEMFRVISEARPAWMLGENVPGIIPMELDNVLSDLERIGYAARPFTIGACCVDAKHRRRRVWIIGRNMADSQKQRDSGNSNNGNSSQHYKPKGKFGGTGICTSLPNSSKPGLEAQRKIPCGTGTQFNYTGDYCRWEPEPNVGRVAHGVPHRVDRLKGLGNAIVPQVAYEILREIRRLL